MLSIIEYKIKYCRHTDFLPPVLHAVHSKKLAFYSISLEMFLLYSSQEKVLSALEAPWMPPSLASCKHRTESIASNINYCSNLADIFFKFLFSIAAQRAYNYPITRVTNNFRIKIAGLP